ncbi:MAG: ATP-binding protein [Rhodoferax sp.]|nr:ATP-binding protein [Rhodoferax sp.]
MQFAKSTSSLRSRLVVPGAAILLVLSLGLIGIGYWTVDTIIKTMSEQLIKHMTAGIRDHVGIMLDAPSRMLARVQNTVTRHHIALSDPNTLAAELHGLLRDEPDVDWLYFANEAGGIVSNGRLENGTQVISMTDQFQAGVFREYNASPDGKMTNLRKSATYFDARQKGWYKTAKETRKPYWTEAYLGAIEPVLGISLSVPVIGKEGEFVGAFGLDLILTRLSKFMAQQRLGSTGRAFLVDGGGYLIAASGGVLPVVLDAQGQQQRLRPAQARDPVVSAAARHLSRHPEIVARARTAPMQSFVFQDADLGRISAAVELLPLSDASAWLIVSALPVSDFLGTVRSAGYLSLFLVAALVVVLLVIGFWTVAWVLRPLRSLTTTARVIADGGWPDVPQTHRNDEIGTLAQALGHMTQSLRDARGALEKQLTELHESRNLLQSILDNSTAAIFVKDLEGRYLLANRRYHELFRIRTDPIIGLTNYDLFPRERADALYAVEQQVAAGRPQKVEEIMQHDDGPHTYLTLKYPLCDPGGKTYALCCIATDITEHKQAEADRQARLSAEAANRTKSEFLATMSHELRTPLNAILGYAQILQRDPGLSEQQAGGLHTIEQSGQHLLTLINDLLDLAKIEAGKIDLYPASMNLGAFLSAIIDIIQVRAEQKGLLFVRDIAPDLPQTVQADEKRLRQVLLNLLSNAVKFTDQGQVSLRLHAVTGGANTARLRFEVADTGVGMAPNELGAIFQPFVQAGDLQHRIGGTGLGLAISRQFLKLMGSDVRVESRLGEGSTFWFELDLPVIESKIEAAREPEVAGYQGARKKILVVDDVAENRTVAIDMLSQLGFEMIAAENGADALEKAKTLPPDLILMDLVMPGMDGLEATRRLRELPAFEDVPIIMLSASTSGGDQQRSLLSGANAFAAKPIERERLMAQIAHFLHLDLIHEPPRAVPVSGDGAAGAFAMPPQHEIEDLYRLARLGNMQDILRWASHLDDLNERYRPFANQLRVLAKGYQSKAILNLAKVLSQQP